MRGLHKHILRGEILYPAVSDTPAWLVVKANAYARANGMSPFVLYQGRWNITFRDMENEVIRTFVMHESVALADRPDDLPVLTSSNVQSRGNGYCTLVSSAVGFAEEGPQI